jgi:transcriptional regulator with XRE-family HTH domain
MSRIVFGDPDVHPLNRHVGTTIRRLREQRGRTQVDLAAEAFGDAKLQPHISKWERGVVRPNLASLCSVARWAGVPLSAFGLGEGVDHPVTETEVSELRMLANRILSIVGDR